MKTKKYSKPEVELIQLDNEISLALQSTPPEGPDEILLTLRYSIYKVNDSML